MSQPNQPQTQSAQAAKSNPATYLIRMKPGCGRMMLGRFWNLPDGTKSTVRPKTLDELWESEEQWLEARDVDNEGNALEGPVVEVTAAQLAKLLDPSGKPKRVIDGYQMQKTNGELTQDIAGNTVSTRTNFSPKAEVGAFDDTTFEIVKRAS